jgi:hypothetical protein
MHHSEVIDICSENHTEHINIVWAGRGSFERHNWWLALNVVLLTAVCATEVAQLYVQLL